MTYVKIAWPGQTTQQAGAPEIARGGRQVKEENPLAHTTLSMERCLEILHKAPVGRLATCRDHEPYVVPVNYVYEGGHIYFHCSPQGRKIDNLAANPRVCFQVDDEAVVIPGTKACDFTAHYYSVIVAGSARVIDDPDVALQAMRALVAKYDPEGKAPPLRIQHMPRERVIMVAILAESIAGVDHSRLPQQG